MQTKDVFGQNAKIIVIFWIFGSADLRARGATLNVILVVIIRKQHALGGQRIQMKATNISAFAKCQQSLFRASLRISFYLYNNLTSFFQQGII